MQKQDKRPIKGRQIQDDSLASPEAKAERLKRVRNLANLSREEFCSDDSISITTLISWEVARFGGLSRKGAVKVAERVAKEGVFVTPEWLLFEVGSGPDVRVDFKKMSGDHGTVDIEAELPSEKEIIIQELMLFRKLNKQTIDYIIDDDAMLPHYQLGDYVAGTKRFGTKMQSLIGKDCIVQTTDGTILMRSLQPGPRENTFNLVATNLRAKTRNAIIYDVQLACAAPVLWHRRRDDESY